MCPLGSLASGSRSIAQSHGQCGGRRVAADLLNTSWNAWYSVGIWTVRWGIGLSMEAEQTNTEVSA